MGLENACPRVPFSMRSLAVFPTRQECELLVHYAFHAEATVFGGDRAPKAPNGAGRGLRGDMGKPGI